MSQSPPNVFDSAPDRTERNHVEATENDRARSDPMAEITAMTEMAKVLTPLHPDSIRRVLSWAADTFQVSSSAGVPKPVPQTRSDGHLGIASESPAPHVEDLIESEDIGEMFAIADPRNDPEKALLVAYWFQTQGNQSDFDSASVNRELKHLGHGASNITNALTSLITRKPQLVIQTRKSGKSQQARKKYKLTNEGIRFARAMLNAEDG